MKKLLSLILVLCMTLALVACGKDEENTAPTTEPGESIAPSESVEPSQPADSGLAALSDRELIGKIIESGKLETPSISAVHQSDEDWLLWLEQNCDAYRELLGRESGLESLRTLGAEVAAEYEDHLFCSLSANRMKDWLLPLLLSNDDAE
jgi:hypothetical protein